MWSSSNSPRAVSRTRRLFRFAAFAAILVFAAAFTISSAPRSSASSPAGCPSVKLFGLRGSYENSKADGAPYGGTLNAVRADLPGASNGALVEEGIPAPGYPATILPPTSTTVIDGVTVLMSDFSSLMRALADAHSATRQSYDASKDSGYSALAAELRSFAASCGGSKFVLMGYSQGAHIAGDMTQTLLNEGLSGVPTSMWIGTVLLGDPAFNPTGGDSGGSFNGSRWGVFGRRASYPASASGHILSLCVVNDIVCGLPRSVGAVLEQPFNDPKAHFKYGNRDVY
jgi:Cutinase